MTSLHSDLVGLSLHEVFHYVQNSDPGAVGAGKYWLDTTSSPFLIKRRNVSDTGWDDVAGSGGGGGAVFSGCLAYRSTNQSISDSTPTAISFDGNFFDVDTYLDPGGNPTRMTVPTGKAGYFSAGANVLWADSALGLREIRFLKNNTDDVGRIKTAPSATDFEQNVNFPIQLADGDYLEVFVTQNSGGPLNIDSLGFHSLVGWLTRLGT